MSEDAGPLAIAIAKEVRKNYNRFCKCPFSPEGKSLADSSPHFFREFEIFRVLSIR